MNEFLKAIKNIFRRTLNVIEYSIYAFVILGNIAAPIIDSEGYLNAIHGNGAYWTLVIIPIVYILRNLINYVFNVERYEGFSLDIGE